MNPVSITITERKTGKKNTKAIRKANRIPVIVYGSGVEENIDASADFHEITRALNTGRGRNILCELDYNGKKIRAVPYQLEVHPVRESVIHVDFLAVREGEKITVTVPLTTEGRSKGQLSGGELIRPRRNIKVKCSPDNIPNNIPIEITELEIGDKIKISEVEYPEGIEPIYQEDVPVVVIREERGMMKEPEEEELEGVEPGEVAVGAEGAEPEADKKEENADA